MKGWIKLDKGITESWLWDDAEHLKRWLGLLMLAAWEPKTELVQGQLIEIGRGQAVVSVRFLQERWAKKNKNGKIVSKPSKTSVTKFLNLLKDDGMILVENRGHQITMLTICNYECCQFGNVANGDTDGDTDGDTNGDTDGDKIKNIRSKERNNILTASKNFEDGDDFKSQILSKVQELQSRLDEQEKAKKPTAKKSASPLVTRGREIFEKRYTDLFGEGYYWQAKDAAAMVSLTKKITYSRKQKGMPTDDDEVLKALEAFLASVTDEWLLKNFSVTNINSKYNEIVAQARARLNYGKTDRQNLCDKRRSSEVTALTAKDYEGSF